MALDGGVLSVSWGRFTLGEIACGLGAVEKKKILPCRESNAGRPAHSL
jgi:hypothetical protein